MIFLISAYTSNGLVSSTRTIVATKAFSNLCGFFRRNEGHSAVLTVWSEERDFGEYKARLPYVYILTSEKMVYDIFSRILKCESNQLDSFRKEKKNERITKTQNSASDEIH